MKRLPAVAFVDAVAVLGVALLALFVGSRWGVDAALGLIGALLLVYAVLASRSEATP